jgi:hypothetical protein
MASLLVVQSSAFAGLSVCAWNFRSEKELSAFDGQDFQARKQAWTKNPAGTTVTDPYDVLALMEVAAERDGFDVLHLSDILEKGTPREKRRVLHLARALRSKKRWTRATLRKTLADLYFVANPPLKGFRLPNLARRALPLSAETLIFRRFELELGANAIEDAFREAGFLRDPRLLGWFKQWKSDRPALFESIRTAAWDAFWIHFLGIPLLLPKGRFSNLLTISDELARDFKISRPAQLKDLPPNVYAAIMKKFGLVGDLDAGLNGARPLVMTAAVGVLALFIFDPGTRKRFPKLGKYFTLGFLTDADLKQYRHKNFDCAAMKKNLWENFREGFKDLRGRYPNPKTHPEDAEIFSTNRARIDALDCDRLEIRFKRD